MRFFKNLLGKLCYLLIFFLFGSLPFVLNAQDCASLSADACVTCTEECTDGGFLWEIDVDPSATITFGDLSPAGNWTVVETYPGHWVVFAIDPAPGSGLLDILTFASGSWSVSGPGCTTIDFAVGHDCVLDACGDCGSVPNCDISSGSFILGTCQDGGTPEDPSDDFFPLTVNLSFTNGSGDVSINGITASPSAGPTANNQDFVVNLPADGTNPNVVVVVGNGLGNCILDLGPAGQLDPCAVAGCTLTASGGIASDEVCGNGSGAISGISTSGGTAPENYSWTNTASTEVSTDLNPINLPSGTYTLAISDGASCSANLGPFTIGNQDIPPFAPAAASPSNYCEGDIIADLTASGSGGTLTWYDDSALSSEVGTGNTFTSGLSTAGTSIFYVTESVGTCESPATVVTVVINPSPNPPSAISPAPFCDSEIPVIISASGSGGTIIWYDDIDLTNIVGSGNNFSYTTATDASFWVLESNGTCSSSATQVDVSFLASPSPPFVPIPPSYCEGEIIADLTASGSGGTLIWYDDLALTNQVNTGSSYSASSLGTNSYWVTESNGTCESSASQVDLTITPSPPPVIAPGPPPYCTGETILPLPATGTGGVLDWYSDPTLTTWVFEGAPYDSGATGTTTFWVVETVGTCVGEATQVDIVVLDGPAPPTLATPPPYCEGETIEDLIATGNGGTINWYSDASLLTNVGTGDTYSPSISTSSSFWVTETDEFCEGDAQQIDISILAAPTAPIPDLIGPFCQGETIPPLTATGTGGTINWYSDGTLLDLVATGTSFDSGISTTTTFWLTEELGTCASPSSQIEIVINTLPSAPTVNSPLSFCSGDIVPDLQASGSGGTLNWYDDPSLITSLGTGDFFASGAISDASFWVTETLNGCTSIASQIDLSFISSPVAPLASSPPPYCQGEPLADLTAAGLGGTLNWYDDNGLTNNVGTGSSFSPNTTVNASYWVTETIGTCESPATQVDIQFNASPLAPIVANPPAYCEGLSPDPLAALGNGGTLTWYSDAALSTEVGTGPSFDSGVTANSSYWVTETVGTCEGPSSQIDISFTAIPSAPNTSPLLNYCEGESQADLTASSSGGTITWYAEATLATVLGTGSPFSFPVVANTSIWVTETLDACESIASQIDINVSPGPNSGSPTNSTFCNNSSSAINLFALLIGADSGGSWTITNGSPLAGSFNASTGTFEVLGQAADNYQFTYEVAGTGSCSAASTVLEIAIEEIPSSTLPTTVATCNTTSGGSVINFDDLIIAGDTEGNWTNTDGVSATGTLPNLDFDGVTPGNYSFTYATNSAVSPCLEQQYNLTVQVEDCACPSVALLNPNPLCNSSGTLDLSTLLLTSETGSWTITGSPSGTNPVSIGSTLLDATNSDPGTYELTFTVDNTVPDGCPISSSINLVIEAYFSAGDSNSTEACNSQSIPIDLNALLVNADPGGIWSVISGSPDPLSYDLSLAQFYPDQSSTGVFQFEYSIAATTSCGASSATHTVTIESQLEAEITPTATICNTTESGSIINFNDLIETGSTSGFWTEQTSSGASGTFPILDFDGLDADFYTFDYTLTNTSPCIDNVYSTAVEVEDCSCPELPELNSFLECNTYIFSTPPLGEFAGEGIWSITGTPDGSNPATLNNSTINAIGADPGDYTLTYTLTGTFPEGCPLQTSVEFELLAQHNAGISLDPIFCETHDSINLFDHLLDADPGGEWFLQDISGSFGIFYDDGVFLPTNEGGGTLTVEYYLHADFVCDPISSFLTLTIVESPKAEIQSTSEICNNSEVGSAINFDNFILSGNSTGTWADLDASGATGEFPNQDFDGIDSGIYNFEYTTLSDSDPSPCEEQSYILELEVQDCSCPEVSLSDPQDFCISVGAFDLANWNLSNSSGEWAISESPAGSDASISGTDFEFSSALAGDYTLTFTLSESPPSGCPSEFQQSFILSSPPYAGDDNSISICNSTFTDLDLFDLIGNPIQTGSWTSLGDPLNPLALNETLGTFDVFQHPAGEYQFIYALAGDAPCPEASSSVFVTIEEAPFTSLPTLTLTCNTSSGGSIVDFDSLISAGDNTGTWNDPDGSGASGSFPILDFDGLAPGPYTFTYTTNSAISPCTETSYILTVSVEDCACPSTAILAPSPICNTGDFLDLSSLEVTVENGTWSISSTPEGSNPAVINDISFLAENADTGTYVISYTLDEDPPDACPSSSEQEIIVSAPPFAGDNTSLEFCSDQLIIYSLEEALTDEATGGNWTIFSGAPLPGSFDNVAATIDINNQLAGTYEFEYSVNGDGTCDEVSAIVSIEIFDPPFAVVTETATVCNTIAEGAVLNLTTFVTDGDLGGTWEDTDDSGAFGSIGNLIFADVDPGVYTYTYTTISAIEPCENVPYEIEIEVQNCACPDLSFTSPEPSCNSELELNLNDYLSFVEAGTWLISSAPVGGNPATLSDNILSILGADAGTYELTYTLTEAVPDGCSNSISIELDLDEFNNAGLDNSDQICTSDITQIELSSYLSSEADLGGTWVLNSGTVPVGSFNESTGSLTVANLSSGDLIFSYSFDENGACPAQSSLFTLTISEAIESSLDSGTAVCNTSVGGSTVNFNDFILIGPSTGIWLDIDGSDATGSFDNLEFDGVEPDTYSFSYTLNDPNSICGPIINQVDIIVQDCSCPGLNILSIDPQCNSSLSINLDDYLLDTEIGTWSLTETPGSTNPATLSGSSLEIENADPGTYALTYTLDNIVPDGCTQSQVVSFNLENNSDAGTGAILSFCSSNYDTEILTLFDELVDADADGYWTTNTNNIDPSSYDLTAGTINLFGQPHNEEIVFTYNFDAGLACPESNSTITITFYNEPQLTVINDETVCNSSASAQGSIIDFSDLILISEGSLEIEDLDGSGLDTSVSILDFDGVAPGNYDFEISTTSAISPCTNVSEIITIEILDCSCPAFSLNEPSPICNTANTVDLSLLEGFSAAGNWTISSTPIGSNPASIIGDEFMIDNNDSGEYELTFTTIESVPDGCPNSNSVLLIVNPNVNAGDDQNATYCDDETFLLVLNNFLDEPSLVGGWTLISGTPEVGSFDQTLGTFNLEDNVIGEFIFQFTIEGIQPCLDDNASVTINIEDCSCPSFSLDSPDPICADSGQSNLSDLELFTAEGDWSISLAPSGINPAIIVGDEFQVSNSDSGIYELTFTVSDPVPGGCPITSTTTIEVINSISAGDDNSATYCEGQTDIINLHDLLTDSSLVGEWTLTSGSPSPGTFDPLLGTFDLTGNVIEEIEFQFTIAAESPCLDDSAIISVSITDCSCVPPSPVIPIVNSLEYCLGDEPLDQVFEASSEVGTAIYWYDGPDPNTAAELGSGTTFTPTVAGSYFAVAIDDSGCTSNAVEFTLTNLLPPSIDLLLNTDTICVLDNVNLAFTTTATDFEIEWNIEGLGSFGEEIADVNWQEGGNYIVEISITDANGCMSNTSEIIVVNEITSFATDYTIELGDSIILEPTLNSLFGEELNYSWTPESEIIEGLNSINPMVSPTEDQLYTLTSIDEFGCTSIVDILVQINEPIIPIDLSEEAILPNAFSPNNDGENDIFRFVQREAIQFRLSIFNRWGQKVFEIIDESDFNFGWDGSFKGVDAEIGVYVYYGEVEFNSGETKIYKGNVSLIR